MSHFAPQTPNNVVPLFQSRAASISAVACEEGLQDALEHTIYALSAFREGLLNARHAGHTQIILRELKNWLADRPVAAALVLEKIEDHEKQVAYQADPRVIQHNEVTASIPLDCAAIVEALDLCQHIFFMEMAITNTILM